MKLISGLVFGLAVAGVLSVEIAGADSPNSKVKNSTPNSATSITAGETGSPYDFTKHINWVRPETKVYTLHDNVLPSKPKEKAKDSSSVASSALQRFVLPNKCRLLVQEIPYDDVVAIELLVKCGAFQEESNLAGYTDFLLELLLNRVVFGENGEDEAEITGSVIDAGTTPDLARLSIVTSSEFSQHWLERLCAALSNPVFSPAEVDKVRSKLLLVLAEQGGNYRQMYEIFLSLFYRYHPYKRSGLGSKLVVENATPESLSEFFNNHFSADKVVLSVSGKLKGAGVLRSVEQRLTLPEYHPETVIATQWDAQAQEQETYLSSSANMAMVMVGYAAPPMYSSDYAAMRCATSALGSGLSSRLWLELREKRGLAYELSGRYPELSGPSHFMCYAVCNATSVGEVRRRIKSEVENFREHGITSQELEDTRNMLIGDFLLKRETNAGKAMHAGMAELLGPGYGADANELADLRRVSVADVNRVARKYFRDPCVLVARPGGRMYFDW